MVYFSHSIQVDLLTNQGQDVVYKPAMLAFGRVRQEDFKSQASLGYIVRP
jgi:hypothetical protein